MPLAGAVYNPKAKRWQARATVDGVRKHLGYFETEQEAHDAFMASRGDRKAKVRGPRPKPDPETATRTVFEDACQTHLMPSKLIQKFFIVREDYDRLLRQCVRLSKELRRSAWHIAHVALCDGTEGRELLLAGKSVDVLAATDNEVRQRMEMVERLDLWDALPDIVDLCSTGERLTFEQAVTDVMDIA